MPFPVDEKYIAATEEKLGVRFPRAFRDKMMQDNGGETEAAGDVWELHPFADTSDRKRLKRTCNDIVRETANARSRAGFPVDAVAIGGNRGGDLLVFLPSDAGPSLRDEVFWWDHETGALHRTADDFGQLRSG